MKKQLFNLKKVALFCATALLSLSTLAQMQVGNSGFENWDNLGTSDEEPTNWNSFMTADCTLGGFMCGIAQKQRVERSTDAHSGSYSARIWSTAVVGIVANGNMTLGRVHMGSSTADDPSNYNFTNISDPDFNQPFTGKPDSLVAWIKFNPVTSTDKGRVSATIHNANNYRDPDDGSATNYVVATAIKNYSTTNGQWKRISVPFEYVGPSTDAQYILITFTTSMTPGGGMENDEVFIDDLEMIYNPNTLDIAPIADQNLFEDEPGTDLTANETPNASSSVTSRQWKSSTTAGGPYTDIAGETGSTYTPQFATAGTYYVVCETDFDGDIVTSNEVKIVVEELTVSIAPTAVQNLVENQPGTTLTATENTVADSRQWKYATTAGGPYSTDITGETGTTYTPQFASAGTYYVVCESTLFGNSATSNEVEVNVTVAVNNDVSIAPNSIQNLIENQAGTDLTATETPSAANTREWQYTTTSGSGYTSFSPAETGTTYTPQFANAGTYYVVCVSDFGGGDIVTSNEVEIVVEELTVSIAPTAVQNLVENQAGTTLTATENSVADSRQWKYATTAGGPYSTDVTGETGTTYTPQFASAGTYYVVCESTLFGNSVTSNEVEINVVEFTVSIDPSADQNIVENEAGTMLTVTEAPTVDSREWKSSTTSGSGYTSFSPAETGTTYTPQFANAGTYYVVCESTISGITATSNEVVVIVTPYVGIDKNTKPSFNVYAKDQYINVDFSEMDMENATMKLHNIQGKIVAKHALENNKMNSIQLTVPTGIYFFSIGNGKALYQGKIFIK